MSVNYNNNGALEKIAGGTLYADNPIGTILAFGGSEIPVGWHLCDGTAVSRTTYAELFAVIGTSFGVGDGSTTFNLPDLQGEFLRGAGINSRSGQGSGANVGEHQDGTLLPAITVGTDGSLFYTSDSASLTFNEGDSTVSTGKRAYLSSATIQDNDSLPKITTRPTNTSVNYIIKMFKVGTPADFDGQDIYSTAERRVGTWIDGKPVYEKTFTGVSFGGTADARSNTEATLDNVDTLIFGYGIRKGDPVYADDTFMPSLGMNGNMITYYTPYTNPHTNILIVRYTKTTD